MNRRRLLLFGLAIACLVASPLHAADPPGSLALDWPMGTFDGTQLLPGHNVRVMQDFGNPNPFYGGKKHAALDLAFNNGSTINAAVYAAADGQVTCLQTLNYPGYVVVLEHTLSTGAKLYSQYGHLNNTLSVVSGQWVNRGSQLGTVLEWPDDPLNSHLHFEVRNFRTYTDGSCAGPGYAPLGEDPLDHGWLDPINEYFGRRPDFEGFAVNDFEGQLVRAAPSLNAGVIGTLAAGARVRTDSVWVDQNGADHWWLRVNHLGGSWGYTVASLDQGSGGDLRVTEIGRYPGPLGLADSIVSGTDLYVFARGLAGNLLYNRRTAAGSWVGWLNLEGATTSEPVVVANSDGRLQVFARWTDKTLRTRRQSAVGSSSWEAWTSLGGIVESAPAAAVNNDGRLQVFVRSSDSALWTRAQSSAGGSWSSWQNLGGVITWGPAVAKNSDGRLAVFVAGSNNNLYQIAQTVAGGAFGGFTDLGLATTSHPVAVRNSDGKLELFVRGAAPFFNLWHRKQNAPGGTWGGWQTRGGLLTSQPRVAVNSDGRLQAFVRGSDGGLYSVAQTSAGGSWGGWSFLGGSWTSGPVVFNQLGKLQVILRGSTNTLYHSGQTTTGWSPFVAIGSPFGNY